MIKYVWDTTFILRNSLRFVTNSHIKIINVNCLKVLKKKCLNKVSNKFGLNIDFTWSWIFCKYFVMLFLAVSVLIHIWLSDIWLLLIGEGKSRTNTSNAWKIITCCYIFFNSIGSKTLLVDFWFTRILLAQYPVPNSEPTWLRTNILTSTVYIFFNFKETEVLTPLRHRWPHFVFNMFGTCLKVM